MIMCRWNAAAAVWKENIWELDWQGCGFMAIVPDQRCERSGHVRRVSPVDWNEPPWPGSGDGDGAHPAARRGGVRSRIRPTIDPRIRCAPSPSRQEVALVLRR